MNRLARASEVFALVVLGTFAGAAGGLAIIDLFLAGVLLARAVRAG